LVIRCEAVGDPANLVVEPPPFLDDDDTRPAAAGTRQIALGFAAIGSRKFDHRAHVCLPFLLGLPIANYQVAYLLFTSCYAADYQMVSLLFYSLYGADCGRCGSACSSTPIERNVPGDCGDFSGAGTPL
jgi:hypothetical protein